MAVTYGASGMPSYITGYKKPTVSNAAGSDNRFKAIKPSPAVVAPNPWDTAVTKIGSGSSSRAAAIAAGVNAGNRSSTSGSNSTLSVSGSGLTPGRTTSTTGMSSRPAALAAGVDGGNRSSTSGSGSTLKVSGSNLGPGQTSTGALVPAPDPGPAAPDLTAPDPAPSGNGASESPESFPEPAQAEAAGMSPEEYQAMLDSAINALLDPEFIGFQGDRAEELRRLQNYRNQLFGYTTDDGREMIGSVGRQQQADLLDRRRLAAERASAGMLQGGAYAGTERGLGTIQEGNQAYALQELQRPFLEQTQTDRLNEFGLLFDPSNRVFNQTDWMMPDWAQNTFAGREAGSRARNQALQQLLAQGISL